MNYTRSALQYVVKSADEYDNVLIALKAQLCTQRRKK